MPLYPEVLQVKERAPTLSLFVVFIFGLIIESIKELGGASQGKERSRPSPRPP
jgi:hypothetical protein